MLKSTIATVVCIMAMFTAIDYALVIPDVQVSYST